MCRPFKEVVGRDVNEARHLEAKAKTRELEAENEAQIVCKNITVQKLLLITRSLSIFVLYNALDYIRK